MNCNASCTVIMAECCRLFQPPVDNKDREVEAQDDLRSNSVYEQKNCELSTILSLDLQTNLSHLLLHREKKLSSYVPAHVAMGSGGLFSTLRGKSSRQAGLEQNLLEAYRKISTSAGSSPEPTQLLHQYLHTCHTLPYYG